MTVSLPPITKVSVDRPDLPAVIKVNGVVFKVEE